MKKNNFQKNNLVLLSRSLQNRRRSGKLKTNNNFWLRYIERIKTRLSEVKLEAFRTKSMTPEEMFLNFLDHERISKILKNAVELEND